MRYFFVLLAMLFAHQSAADSVFATHTLRAKEIILPGSVHLKSVDVSGGAQALEEVVGFELKRAVYAGRPILISNVARPALVERNQIVRAVFEKGNLRIETDARAMERGAAGDVIQAMNLSSKKPIRARVMENGQLMALQ